MRTLAAGCVLLLAICCLRTYGDSRDRDDSLPRQFADIAKSLRPVTDKVTNHRYQEMYGRFLMPIVKYRHRKNESLKLFEIGLGCGDHKVLGTGASAQLWLSVLSPHDILWFAEFDKECVDSLRAKGKISDRLNIVTGDQEDIPTLEQWVSRTGGEFDIIIDDGGHNNNQIFNTFNVLFHKALKPGGLYFVEDLQASRFPARFRGIKPTTGPLVMVDVIKDWIEQLLTIPAVNITYIIPKGIKYITCQYEACVIAKCTENDVARCS